MLKAYKKFWEGYADFIGYSTVSEYWWPHFIHLLITMPLFYALIQLQIDPNDVSKRCRIALVISSCCPYSIRRLAFHASFYDPTNESRQ